jgi:membrane protein DedA with SNARE-associated domain
MNPAAFAMYTLLGAGIWATTLTLIGYFIGDNIGLINEYLHILIIGLIIAVIITIATYALWQRRIAKNNMS